MITMVNYKSQASMDKYNFIFTKAWNDLKTREFLRDDEDTNRTQFSDLGHFFSYLKTLVSIDPLYVLLPSDEAPFEIDANSRLIKVPSEFNKCSGVQSDNYAEIITFTIDRYFDYQDLGNARIAVQWINASGKEGVSYIELIDLETLSDQHKIRFGWPLSSEMTEAAGDLRFAVRFFVESKIQEEGKSEEITEFTYVFNTEPARIPIKKSLNIDLNKPGLIEKTSDFSIFRQTIQQSENPSLGAPTPVIIAKDLPSAANLENDTLELSVLGFTKDQSPLKYEWYRGKDIIDVSGGDLRYRTEFKREVYTPDTWPQKKPNTTLWQEITPTGGTPYYIPYTPFEWPDQKPENIILYDSLGDTLVFNSEDYILDQGYAKPDNFNDITGEYHVKVYNNKGNWEKEHPESYFATTAESIDCIVKAPDEIVIENEIPKEAILNQNADTKLTIQLNNSTDPRFAKLNGDSAVEVQNNEISFNITSVGEYTVEISSTLNREAAKPKEVKCIYGYGAAIPGVKKQNGLRIYSTTRPEAESSFRLTENYVTFQSDHLEPLTLEVDAILCPKTELGEEYTVYVNNNNGTYQEKTEKLSKYSLANNFTYEWYISKNDSTDEFIKITDLAVEKDEYGLGLKNFIPTNQKYNSNKLDVINVVNNDDTTPDYTYKCVVTNKCFSQTATNEFYFYIY